MRSVGVALSAPTPGQEHDFLSVFGNLCTHLPTFGIQGHRTQGHFENFIATTSTAAQGTSARLAPLCHHMFSVFEVKQGPQLAVSPHQNMPSSAAIPPIRTSFCRMLIAVEVNAPRTTGPTAAADLNVINKVLLRHRSSDGATVYLPTQSLKNLFYGTHTVHFP